MSLISLLKGLGERAPWQSAARPILLATGFDIRKGLPKTLEAAERLKDTADQEAELSRFLIEHAVAGEKLIQLVKVSEQERKDVAKWVAARRRSSHDLGAIFPGILEADDAEDFFDVAPVPCGNVDLEQGSAAFYSAVRAHHERVTVPQSLLKPGVTQSYQKIIGIKRTLRQTHEAIWVPPTGKVIGVAVDLPRGYPKAFADLSLEFLRGRLRKSLGRPLEFYNLWHAVDGLYAQKGDGKLVDYGFSVGGRSVNHHKLRRNGECLRVAVYDAAGAAAVGNDLQLFKIALRWQVQHRDGSVSEPELLLPGTAIHLNQANAVIDQFILRDARTSFDLNFVINKLLPHAR